MKSHSSEEEKIIRDSESGGIGLNSQERGLLVFSKGCGLRPCEFNGGEGILAWGFYPLRCSLLLLTVASCLLILLPQ